jgi:hypothetical protein
MLLSIADDSWANLQIWAKLEDYRSDCIVPGTLAPTLPPATQHVDEVSHGRHHQLLFPSGKPEHGQNFLRSPGQFWLHDRHPFSLMFEAITGVQESSLGATAAMLDPDHRTILRDGLRLVQIGDVGQTFNLIVVGGDIDAHHLLRAHGILILESIAKHLFIVVINYESK